MDDQVRESDDEDVQAFLEDTQLADKGQFEILCELRELVFEVAPDVDERMKYGGIMFSLDEDFGGLFVYTNHVSFEFGEGHRFDDPDELLDGSGESRRHLKFETVDDVRETDPTQFIEQAV